MRDFAEQKFLPSELPAEILKLSWLLGNWEGSGQIAYPGEVDINFVQQVRFENDGTEIIKFSSDIWELNSDLQIGEKFLSEVGFWKLNSEENVEVALSQSSQVSEIWTGFVEVLQIVDAQITSARARLVTDLSAAPPSSKGINKGDRLYALMNGELLWTYDKSTREVPMRNYLWARLSPIRYADYLESQKTQRPIRSYVLPRPPGQES
jgi:hypothetical protein